MIYCLALIGYNSINDRLEIRIVQHNYMAVLMNGLGLLGAFA